MTADEFAYIAAALQTAFPWAKLFPNEQAMDIWFKRLEDIPGHVATTVVNRWLETKREPPSIADIRANADLVINGDQPSWGDGWEQVKKAIRRFGYYQQENALASMNDLARQTVQRLGWQEICVSENPDAIRANFRMVYEILQKRQREDRILSGSVKEDIAAIQGKHPDTTRLISGLADSLRLKE